MSKRGSFSQGTNQDKLSSKQLKALGSLGFAIVDGQIELRPEYLRHDTACKCDGCEVVISIKRTYEAAASFVKTYPLYVSRCNLHTQMNENDEGYEKMLSACKTETSGSACWHEAKLNSLKWKELWGKYPQEQLLRTIGTNKAYDSLWIEFAGGNRSAIDEAILTLWGKGMKRDINGSDSDRYPSGYQNWQDYHKNSEKDDFVSVNEQFNATWLSKNQHQKLAAFKAKLAS